MIEVLAPSGFMRSSPDGTFLSDAKQSFFTSFLSRSFYLRFFCIRILAQGISFVTNGDIDYLIPLKLLRPEFAQLLTREMEDEIFDLIGRLITTFQDLAIDERHTPHLYARFLASLLTRHRKGGAGVGGNAQPQPPTSQFVHQSDQPRSYPGPQKTPPSHMQHSVSSSKSSSQSRYDMDTMQMNSGPPPGISEALLLMPITHTPTPEFVDNQQIFPPVAGTMDSVVTDTGIDDMLSDVGTLATMRALNDAWWGNMMMPG